MECMWESEIGVEEPEWREGEEEEEEEEAEEEEEEEEEEVEEEEEEEEEGEGRGLEEKEIIFSRVIGNGVMLETEKKIDQKAGHTHECLILSVMWPQEKAQPSFLAPNRERVHQ